MIPQDPPVALLGIILDNVTSDEVIDQIQLLIEKYKKDLHPRYVATANVDYLVQVNSCLSSDVLNPELMHILREAKIVTADGMPLVWLSALLGSPIKERVTGIDLLPKLAQAVTQKKQSLFLLGGEEKTLKLCILYLQALHPGINIVSALHPKIYAEGEIQESNDQRDLLLAEQINRAAPDVLLINLGNPKQEFWFERIKQKLHVPVSIGVGGAFDLLSGMIPRAPVWMQKSGLEWLYRLYQSPMRLFTRYLRDLIKFPLLSIPVILFHNLNKLFYKIFYGKEQSYLRNNLLFISPHQTIVVVPLPHLINGLVANEIRKEWDDLFSQDVIIFDFQDVKHIDLEGSALLLLTWRRAYKDKKQLYALGMNWRIRCLLRLHRIWDYISPYVCKTPHEVIMHFYRNGQSASFYDAVQQNHNYVVISLFGRLDNQIDYEAYLKKIGPIIFQKECILNMTYCTYIDHAGISFLLKLRKNKPQVFIKLKLFGLNKIVARQLRQAHVYHLFEIISNLNRVYD